MHLSLIHLCSAIASAIPEWQEPESHDGGRLDEIRQMYVTHLKKNFGDFGKNNDSKLSLLHISLHWHHIIIIYLYEKLVSEARKEVIG
jgi:hypothetical protein